MTATAKEADDLPVTPVVRRHLTESGWGATLIAPAGTDDGALGVRLERHPLRTALAFLVGVHGGAGVTCLASQLDHLADSGREWPGRDDESPHTLLVARESLAGMTALHTVLRAYAAGSCPAHVQLAGLVVVACSPDKPAAPVRQKRELCERVLGPGAVPVYQISWHRHLISTEIAALPSAGPGIEPQKRWNPKRQPPPDVLDLGNRVAGAILSAHQTTIRS
jgi:hypothetical protein